MSNTNRTKPRGQHRHGRPGLVAAGAILDEHRKLRLVEAGELDRERIVAEIQADSTAALLAVEAKQREAEELRAIWGAPAGWSPYERIADHTIPYVLVEQPAGEIGAPA